MNKEEAETILKQSLASFAVKYPQLIRRLNGYFKSFPDTNIAMSTIISKLIEIDQFAEWTLKEELDIDSSDLRNAN